MLTFLFFFIFVGLLKTEVTSLKLVDKSLEGLISFPVDTAPEKLQSGSCLTVKVEDTSLQDVSSVVIMRAVVKDIDKAYTKGGLLKYKLNFPSDKELVENASYTVSAVVNCGWCPEGGSQEWIKSGDFLTDKSYLVDIKKCLAGDCKVDICLVKNN